MRVSKAQHRLSPLAVKKAGQGMYHDGRGLYLHVGPNGSRSWLFRYQMDGKPRFMGLGPFPEIGLADARVKLEDARREKANGVDPLAARDAARNRAKADAAAAITFKACTDRYIASHRAGWRNEKHAAQWGSSLEAYAYPVIGALPVGEVDTGHVTRFLEPIWVGKPETAGRVRGRVEAILDFAKVHGWRTGENPARWKGHLQNVLPARGKVRKVAHHAALPWGEAGAFIGELAKQHGIAALALRFAIVTAARTGEVIGARWAEIDLTAGVWTVPAERMKGRAHRVPLSGAALAVLG
ncbi:MAG: tyrosine-type recombinase/integrase, partial [Acetobacteraceae bacterium]